MEETIEETIEEGQEILEEIRVLKGKIRRYELFLNVPLFFFNIFMVIYYEHNGENTFHLIMQTVHIFNIVLQIGVFTRTRKIYLKLNEAQKFTENAVKTLQSRKKSLS